MSTFGILTAAGPIERAVLALLEKWYPTYLREVERQWLWEDAPLATPKNYSRRNSLDIESGELIPKVVAVSPGLFEPPELGTDEFGNSVYKARWQVGVGVATAATTEDKADDMVKMYAAATRGIVLQHQDLSAPDLGVCDINWIDESYDDITTLNNQSQLFRAAQVDFGIEIESAVSRWGGPAFPSEAEQPAIEAEEVIVQVDRKDPNATGVTVTEP